MQKLKKKNWETKNPQLNFWIKKFLKNFHLSIDF